MNGSKNIWSLKLPCTYGRIYLEHGLFGNDTGGGKPENDGLPGGFTAIAKKYA